MYIITYIQVCVCVCVCVKDGMNLEFHSNRISSKFRIRIEYSVASNSIRILNGVEMSSRDATSSRAHGHKSGLESSASWPYATIFLFTFCLFLFLT